jgi:hypothetical protein
MGFKILLLCAQLALRAVHADCDWTVTSRGFRLRNGGWL